MKTEFGVDVNNAMIATGLFSRNLVAMPVQAMERIEYHLSELKKELDNFHGRSGYAIASDCSRRIEMIQGILHRPEFISEMEAAITNGHGT